MLKHEVHLDSSAAQNFRGIDGATTATLVEAG